MLTYSFEDRGTTPLYYCLYENIKTDILNGNLKANEKLPSKRSFSQHLKISVVTIENAYSQLLLEGYIYSIEKRGYFVSKLEQTTVMPIKPKKIRNYEKPQKKPNEYLDLKSNSICSEKFPFSIWSKLMREVLSEQNTHLLDAAPYNGVEELRIAIADYLYHFRGMSVFPDQIVIGAGTEYLYSLVIQLLGREKTFAVENPGYKKLANIYEFNGVQCEFIRLDKHGMSIKNLEESSAQIVHISPSHHFPTGVVMPIKRRQEILKWANEGIGRYIIEDDYDSEFRFSGKPIQTIQSIDTREKVIFINTFSKTIAPSIRISYMVLPYSLMKLFREKLSFYSCTVPSFEQYALAKFITKGYFEQHINRMRNYYKTRRDFIIKAIKQSPFGDKVTILEEDAGLHFLLKIDTKMTDSEILRSAYSKGIKLSCLSQYYHHDDTSASRTIIVNYSGMDSSEAGECINRLSKLFI